MIEVALYQPEIPPNTGNIGRLCVGYGVRLGLIGPIGFSLDEKALRRAGLDYWPKLEFEVFADFASFWERRVLAEILHQRDLQGQQSPDMADAGDRKTGSDLREELTKQIDTPTLPRGRNSSQDKATLSQGVSMPHGEPKQEDQVVLPQSISMPRERRRVICLSKHGTCLLHDWTFRSGDILLLGNETRGVPFALSETYEFERIAIPMSENIRSYNLANAAAMAVSEAYRQLRWTL